MTDDFVDPYVDPDSGILRNKLGIEDVEVLHSAERELTLFRSIQLVNAPISGKYDLAHLCAIHRHIFADLYDWAGETRTVDTMKGSSPFCSWQQIPSYAAQVFSGIASERWGELDEDQFLDALVRHLAEVNALHPFYEGNGRAQRAFFSQLAYSHGFDIEWPSDARANDDASAHMMRNEFEPMRMLLAPCVRRAD